ncbi:hypothetical protein RO575_13465 [Methylomonas sp. MO1]|uniref:hypothetical protein n=1 Tax=unclassified Methylomonas TaxID=2608980 RepID=UPI001268EAEB|nr:MULTISPECIES: hypothetical protein [unclassified Methylomonas]MDT4290568.1 hypothetical protein [Methylomonas sp. MO1]
MSYMSINSGASQIHSAAGANVPTVKKAQSNSPTQAFQQAQTVVKEADQSTEGGKGRFIDVRA